MKRDPPPLANARELRKNLTLAEAALWKRLRAGRFLGLHFRRQHILGPYIVDFYCASRRLAIELDGDVHVGRETADEKRSDWLRSQGVEVLRFWNNDVHQEMDHVLAAICAACEAREDLPRRTSRAKLRGTPSRKRKKD